MEFQTPKPDLLRSLASLASARSEGTKVRLWVPAVALFTGYIPWEGRVLDFVPEEGSGHIWIVTLRPADSPVQDHLLYLDNYPRVSRIT